MERSGCEVGWGVVFDRFQLLCEDASATPVTVAVAALVHDSASDDLDDTVIESPSMDTLIMGPPGPLSPSIFSPDAALMSASPSQSPLPAQAVSSPHLAVSAAYPGQSPLPAQAASSPHLAMPALHHGQRPLPAQAVSLPHLAVSAAYPGQSPLPAQAASSPHLAMPTASPSQSPLPAQAMSSPHLAVPAAYPGQSPLPAQAASSPHLGMPALHHGQSPLPTQAASLLPPVPAPYPVAVVGQNDAIIPGLITPCPHGFVIDVDRDTPPKNPKLGYVVHSEPDDKLDGFVTLDDVGSLLQTLAVSSGFH
jgi:hypothetical protein